MTFTKEQLLEIANRFAAALPNVALPRDLYEKGWLVSRFALSLLERAENAEAERDEAAALVVTSRGEAHMATLAKERYMAERDRLRGELEEAEEAIRRLSWRLCPDCVGDGILGADWKGELVACESCGGHEDRRGDGWISDTVDNIAETMESPAVRRARERGGRG